MDSLKVFVQSDFNLIHAFVCLNLPVVIDSVREAQNNNQPKVAGRLKRLAIRNVNYFCDRPNGGAEFTFKDIVGMAKLFERNNDLLNHKLLSIHDKFLCMKFFKPQVLAYKTITEIVEYIKNGTLPIVSTDNTGTMHPLYIYLSNVVDANLDIAVGHPAMKVTERDSFGPVCSKLTTAKGNLIF